MAVRHVRDPITGLCSVCGKSGLHDHSLQATSHDADDVTRDQTWRHNERVVYVDEAASSYSSRQNLVQAPSPHSVDSFSRSQRAAHVRPVFVQQRPVSRARHPSRSSSCCRRCCNCCHDNNTAPSCCSRPCRRKVANSNTPTRQRRHYDDEYGGTDHCCGYSDYETASYGAGTWGPRRCCAMLIALGVLLALAGLAVGLYFGISAAVAENKRKQQVASYLSTNDQVNYIVYGADQPCNAYNNGTATSPLPNCNRITTRIVRTNNFVAPTDPSWAAASSVAIATKHSAAYMNKLIMTIVTCLTLITLRCKFSD